MYRSTVVLLLLGAMLAGCTDPEPAARRPPTSAECLEQGRVLDPDAEGGGACVEPAFDVRDFEDPRHHCVVTQQRDRVHAPDLVGNAWVQGQWWDYAMAMDGEGLGTTRLVYYDDQDFDSRGVPQHYMVGTVTREEALHHALFGANPMIGRVHRVLYSPHESGDHADMFHFPLCDGSSWSTRFYGETFQLTARNATVQVPGRGGMPGFVIAGASPGGGSLELSYVPAAQWFTYIDLRRSGGGSVRLQLEDLGKDQIGQAFFLRGQQDEVLELSGSGPAPFFSGPVAEQAFVREDGAEGPYDSLGLAVAARVVGQGTGILEILDPHGEVAWRRTLGGQEPPAIDHVGELPYQQGTWTVRLHGAALDPAHASVEATVRVVSIYDRSGTV